MPRGRPKGSKSRSTDAYAKRTVEVKHKYGEDIFRQWGNMGGNPVLLRKNKETKKEEKVKKWPSWY